MTTHIYYLEIIDIFILLYMYSHIFILSTNMYTYVYVCIYNYIKYPKLFYFVPLRTMLTHKNIESTV